MATDSELLKSLSIKAEKEDTPDVKGFLIRNLKYWPLLMILMVLAVLLSWLYLRYTPKSYRADAMMAIKKDPALMSEGGLSISLMDDKVALEKEVEILKSPDAIEATIIRLRLYADIKAKGRLLKRDRYADDSPFIITVEDPLSLTAAGPFDIRTSAGNKTISLGGKTYKIGEWQAMPWGKTKIEYNPNFKAAGNDEFELSFIPIDALRKRIGGRLSADTRTKLSELIIMTFNDHHPKRAVDILQTLVSVYDAITVESKKAGFLSTYEFIDARLSKVEKELNGVESELQKFKSSNSIVDLSTQGAAYLESVQATDQQVAELDVKIDMVNKAKSYLSKGPAESGSLPAMLDVGDVSLSTQIGELNKTELKLNSELQLSGPDNPRVKVLEEQSRRLKASVTEGLNNLSKNLISTRSFYMNKQAGFGSMLKSIPQKEKGLIDITRQQAIKNGIFSFLLQKREEAAIAVAGTVPNSQFIRKPLYGGVLKPTAFQTLLIAVPLALLAFFVFVAIKEMLRNQLEDKQEIDRHIGAPIIGELGLVKRKKGAEEQSIIVGEGVQSIEAEQFRDLRTNLGYLGMHNDRKVILVTSSMPGEGKTYVSINLAISLSLTGKKVALLCLDLRRPRLSKEMGVSAFPGITNYLIGSASLEEITNKLDNYPSLTILPEGSIPPNPAELLMDSRMGELVDALRKQYDYIIFDSPPIGAVTDAKILGNYASVSVYVTRVGKTLKSFYPVVKDAFETKKLPNMGIVVNGIKHSKLSSYNQRYGYNDNLK